MTERHRPHLAVALLCAVTLAGLLWVALKAPPAAESDVRTGAPRLHDEPFRGVPKP